MYLLKTHDKVVLTATARPEKGKLKNETWRKSHTSKQILSENPENFSKATTK